MKKEDKKTNKFLREHNEKIIPTPKENETGDKEFPGYPHYPASEDIFNKEKELNIDLDDLTKVKSEIDQLGKKNAKDFDDDKPGEEFYAPGSVAEKDKNIAENEEE